jgi:hypothetical protein
MEILSNFLINKYFIVGHIVRYRPGYILLLFGNEI